MVEILTAVLTGGIVAYSASQLEVFRSNFVLALLMAIGVGVASALAEVGLRRLVGTGKS